MGGGVSGLFKNTIGGKNAILIAANGNDLSGYLNSVKTENLSTDTLSDRQVKNALKKAKSATFNGGSGTDRENTLVFDGIKMNLYENGKQLQSWNGVSGKDGFQTKEY